LQYRSRVNCARTDDQIPECFSLKHLNIVTLSLNPMKIHRILNSETGEVQVLKMTTTVDGGIVPNPQAFEGQLEGGMDYFGYEPYDTKQKYLVMFIMIWQKLVKI
jgi:hypothetical protein